MATILKTSERAFVENPKISDYFSLFTDSTRTKKGVEPENLNFDVRQLPPQKYCAAYHFHRHAEELFVILAGAATLRTPKGLEVVTAGDIIFFEKGETGAHQLYNHTSEICTYLDIRTYIGHDICEYPDSNKLFIVPTYEIFDKGNQLNYADGEDRVEKIWEKLRESL